MAAILPVAPVLHGGLGKIGAADDRNAVIAFHPVPVDVPIPGGPQRLGREVLVRRFRFLQAQNVGVRFTQQPQDKLDAEADGIDVPGDQPQNGSFSPAGRFIPFIACAVSAEV